MSYGGEETLGTQGGEGGEGGDESVLNVGKSVVCSSVEERMFR